MSAATHLRRLGYLAVTAISGVGALSGCVYCVPLFAALVAAPLIKRLSASRPVLAASPV